MHWCGLSLEEHAQYVLVLVLVVCWCSIGIGVGMVVGVGMCIGICVAVAVGIGVRMVSSASIWQYMGSLVACGTHSARYSSIWEHVAASALAASGSIWDDLKRLGSSYSIWVRLAASGSI